MTEPNKPEALRLAELLELAPEDGVEPQTAEDAAAELLRQHTRIAELEAQLESIGAGGVSGPLMGCASIAASAGSEPVAHLWQHSETGRTRIVMPDMIVDADASWQVVGPLYLGATPPTAQAEGWTKLPGTLPKPGTPVLLDIGKEFPIRAMWAAKFTLPVSLEDDSGFGEHDERTDEWYCPEGWYEWNEHEEIHWRVTETPRAWAPLPPTTSAGSKGE